MKRHCFTKEGGRPMEVKFLDQKQAAALLGRSPKSLERDRQKGRGLPYVRFGPRCIRYALPDILEFAQANRIEPSA